MNQYTFDLEDYNVLWGMVGGLSLGIVNAEIIQGSPKLQMDQLYPVIALFSATGALGGLIGGMFLSKPLGSYMGPVAGGVLLSWFLLVAGRLL